MTDLEALTLLVTTTAATVGVLTVGLLEAAGRLPRDRRSAHEAAPTWRAVAGATWPATWGMSVPPTAPTTAEAAQTELRHSTES